jgi:hypothetical protein
VTSKPHPLQDGAFDALALLRRSRGDDELRDIKLRLLWLRQRELDARVTTSLASLDERAVVMHAAIALPGGGEGSGHAASQLDEMSDIAREIEATELRALGRALDVLGYVVTDPASSRPAPAPAATPEPATPHIEPPATEPEPVPGPTPAQRRQPPEHIQAIRTLREREQQAASTTEPEAPAEPEATPAEPTPLPIPPRPTPVPPAPDDAEPELEDVSWTAFWTWARQTYQIGSRVQVEELLGQPVDRKQPGELRRLLVAHFEHQESPDD